MKYQRKYVKSLQQFEIETKHVLGFCLVLSLQLYNDDLCSLQVFYATCFWISDVVANGKESVQYV